MKDEMSEEKKMPVAGRVEDMLFYIFEYFRVEKEKETMPCNSVFFSILSLEQDIIYERIADLNKDVFDDLKREFDDRWEERKKEEKRGMNR